jgi:hypothetical protein
MSGLSFPGPRCPRSRWRQQCCHTFRVCPATARLFARPKWGVVFVGGSQRGHLGNSDGRCSGEYARPRCGGRLSWPHRFGPRLLLGLSLLIRPALRLGLHSTSSVARSAVVSAPWMGESQVNMAAHRHALIGGLQNQVQSRSAGQRPVGGFGARRKIFVKCTKVKRTNLGSI